MFKSTKPSILDNIQIASPCTVSWNSMKGDDFSRHCGQCKLSVYNISNMSKKEAEKLITQSEGRLCIRLYKRLDGTVITNDCPVALRKIKQSCAFIFRIAAAFSVLILGASPVKAQERMLQGKPQAHPSHNQSNTNTPRQEPATRPGNGTPMMGKTPQNQAKSNIIVKGRYVFKQNNVQPKNQDKK